MVELELLQRGERAVTVLAELERPLSELVGLREPVVSCGGLAQERDRDQNDREHRDHRTDHESDVHDAATWGNAYRDSSLRCSRASGQSVISEPKRKTTPASQMKLTRGLTSALK